eukprot:5985525-Ditylum_brightwellii.AAC.1
MLAQVRRFSFLFCSPQALHAFFSADLGRGCFAAALDEHLKHKYLSVLASSAAQTKCTMPLHPEHLWLLQSWRFLYLQSSPVQHFPLFHVAMMILCSVT